MKNTNSKEYKQAIREYILSSLKEDLNLFWDCFESEFNHSYNQKRYPNLQVRVSEYLKGLPSCINIAFANYKILELAKKWHECEFTEKEEEKIIDNWFMHIAYHILKLSGN